MVAHERDGREEERCRDERDLERHAECDRGRAHQATEDRADAPDPVERVDDRASVGALHPQPVRVLTDVGDRVDATRDEQDRGEHSPARGEADEHERAREADDPDGGDPRRAEPLDEGRREHARHERTQRKGRERRPEPRVAEPEVVADLGIPRDDVCEERPVREEHRSDREARGLGLAAACERGHA